MVEPEISSQAYAQIRANPDRNSQSVVLLDVRESWEVELASIPGAVLIPLGEITSRAHTELDPDQPVVVLCHHGARSLSVAMWLRAQGFDHAQSLSGGIDGWSRTVDSSIPLY